MLWADYEELEYTSLEVREEGASVDVSRSDGLSPGHVSAICPADHTGACYLFPELNVRCLDETDYLPSTDCVPDVRQQHRAGHLG